MMLFARMYRTVPMVAAFIAFGLCVCMACGATYAIVPFVNRKAVGSVSGIVGAGGNAAAVAAGFLFGHVDWHHSLFVLGAVVTGVSFLAWGVRFTAAEEAGEDGPGAARVPGRRRAGRRVSGAVDGSVQMDREDVTVAVIAAKRKAGVNWRQLAEAVGQSKEWTTAALLGQMQMTAAEAAAAGGLLGLDAEAVAILQEVPQPRGRSTPTCRPTRRCTGSTSCCRCTGRRSRR